MKGTDPEETINNRFTNGYKAWTVVKNIQSSGSPWWHSRFSLIQSSSFSTPIFDCDYSTNGATLHLTHLSLETILLKTWKRDLSKVGLDIKSKSLIGSHILLYLTFNNLSSFQSIIVISNMLRKGPLGVRLELGLLVLTFYTFFDTHKGDARIGQECWLGLANPLTGMRLATTKLEKEASMRIAVELEESILTKIYGRPQRYVVYFLLPLKSDYLLDSSRNQLSVELVSINFKMSREFIIAC